MELREAARVSQRQGADTLEVRELANCHGFPQSNGRYMPLQGSHPKDSCMEEKPKPQVVSLQGGDRIASTELAVWVPGCVPLFLAPWPEMSLTQGPASVAPGSCWVAWEGSIVALCPIM